jgi:hypothetical protein
MNKYNKKNCLVFFFARHFFTGHGKRHGLAPVRCGTMVENERKLGGDSGMFSSSSAWRMRAWRGRQRRSELGIAPASMVERQWLESSGWPTRARWKLSRGDPQRGGLRRCRQLGARWRPVRWPQRSERRCGKLDF